MKHDWNDYLIMSTHQKKKKTKQNRERLFEAQKLKNSKLIMSRFDGWRNVFTFPEANKTNEMIMIESSKMIIFITWVFPLCFCNNFLFLMRYESIKRKLRRSFCQSYIQLESQRWKHLCELLLAGVEERNMAEHMIVIRLHILDKFFNIPRMETSDTNHKHTAQHTVPKQVHQPSISIIFIMHRMHSCILIPLFAAWTFEFTNMKYFIV